MKGISILDNNTLTKSAIAYLIISGVIGGLIGMSMNAISDILLGPRINIGGIYTEQGNQTLAEISVTNNGLKPATDLRITLDPQVNITKSDHPFYMEAIYLKPTGPKSLIAIVPRLANGATVTISTLLDSNEKDMGNYAVFVTSSAGSTTYQKDYPDYSYLLGLSGMILAIGFGLMVRSKEKRNRDKDSPHDRMF